MKLNRINSRKLKHGSVSVTLTVLIVVAAIMLNVAVTMLANNYNWMYIDMTAEQLFTLSDDCVELLDRSFIKIMNNRESLNKELPKTNHGIAVDNVAAAEKNVELAKNAITVALSNIEAAKENHVYFEQSVIKARSNLNIAESNLEFAELILEHAEETGDAELKAIAEENLNIANENLNTAKDNLNIAANNAQKAINNAENKTHNDKNSLKEGDDGYRPMEAYEALKEYKPYTEADKIKDVTHTSFIDHLVYENMAIAEENLAIAQDNLTIANENLEKAKANETVAKRNADKDVIAGESGYEALEAYKPFLSFLPYVTVSNFTEPVSFESPTKLAALASFDTVLSLNLLSAAEKKRADAAAATAAEETDPVIDGLIAQRKEAKKAKNFAEADRIRDELKAMGIEITDTPQGTKWKRI